MRLTAKIAVATFSIALAACWAFEVAESIGASLFPGIRARADALSREARQREEFDFHSDWISRELAEGRVSLREASRLLEASAAERWPAFLTYIEMSAASGNRRVKLAYSLLLQLRYELSPCNSERLEEIEREYQTLTAEEQEKA
jgi:hypothetical protein